MKLTAGPHTHTHARTSTLLFSASPLNTCTALQVFWARGFNFTCHLLEHQDPLTLSPEEQGAEPQQLGGLLPQAAAYTHFLCPPPSPRSQVRAQLITATHPMGAIFHWHVPQGTAPHKHECTLAGAVEGRGRHVLRVSRDLQLWAQPWGCTHTPSLGPGEGGRWQRLGETHSAQHPASESQLERSRHQRGLSNSLPVYRWRN